MRICLVIILVCLTGVVLAGERKSILRQGYVVVSDVYHVDVPEGKCLVRGQVLGPEYTAAGELEPLNGATISTLDRKKSTVTAEGGNYKFLVDTKDTTLYFFMAGYDEIVIWKYLFQSKHVVTINFYPYYNNQIYEVDKPVIYLYSDSLIDADVRFACKGAVTFTYPVYNEGWKVQVSENGISESKTGKTYPYLFWEAETNDLDFKFDENGINATVIKTDTVVSYLENSLTSIGLNNTELTDFITFWAPQMVQHEYVLVQFLTGEVYEEKISTLSILPKPDALLRVYMLWRPLPTSQLPFSLNEQVFTPFKRKGFTVVEWGGTQLPALESMP